MVIENRVIGNGIFVKGKRFIRNVIKILKIIIWIEYCCKLRLKIVELEYMVIEFEIWLKIWWIVMVMF